MMYGGYIKGKLAWMNNPMEFNVDGYRTIFVYRPRVRAIFKTKREAKMFFDDVRKVMLKDLTHKPRHVKNKRKI